MTSNIQHLQLFHSARLPPRLVAGCWLVASFPCFLISFILFWRGGGRVGGRDYAPSIGHAPKHRPPHPPASDAFGEATQGKEGKGVMGEGGGVGVEGGGASSSLALAWSHSSCARLSWTHVCAGARPCTKSGWTSEAEFQRRPTGREGRKQFFGGVFFFPFSESGDVSQPLSTSRFPELRTRSLSSDHSSGHSGIFSPPPTRLLCSQIKGSGGSGGGSIRLRHGSVEGRHI